MDRLSPGAGVDRAKKVKRQRKHSNGLLKMGVPYTGCTQPNIAHTGSLEISKLECGELSGVKDPTISDSNDASGSICAFCQSSGVKDVSSISGCVGLFISFTTIDIAIKCVCCA